MYRIYNAGGDPDQNISRYEDQKQDHERAADKTKARPHLDNLIAMPHGEV
jgi:hypothetical protein